MDLSLQLSTRRDWGAIAAAAFRPDRRQNPPGNAQISRDAIL
ncbi:MAG TPA: hypothetical protein VE291_08625 [Terracidiphilus sp.]|nr:hypothetical protein [Terracidiphilus sp.]